MGRDTSPFALGLDDGEDGSVEEHLGFEADRVDEAGDLAVSAEGEQCVGVEDVVLSDYVAPCSSA